MVYQENDMTYEYVQQIHLWISIIRSIITPDLGILQHGLLQTLMLFEDQLQCLYKK